MSATRFGPAPSICVLRLSAIGDAVQVVPTVRALQDRWPGARITWIMGAAEARLLGDLDGAKVVVYRKGSGWRGLRRLARELAEERFDVLLHMHASLRANLVSRAVSAPLKIGFDRARSRDLHGFFVNRRLPPDPGAHVLEGFFSFGRALGVETDELRWDIPLLEPDRAFARSHLPPGDRWLVVSPASSHPLRNWSPTGYARVAAHAADRHGMRIALCGGPTELERRLADAIAEELGRPIANLVGRDTLKKLLALLERATALLSPDSGPAHMASAVGTPVLGLYAATDPSRSGPYRSLEWCVNRFDEAARKFRKSPADALPWSTKLEHAGVMDLIDPEAVIRKLDALMARIDTGGEVAAPPRIRGRARSDRKEEAQSEREDRSTSSP